jgi:hypothetical protein
VVSTPLRHLNQDTGSARLGVWQDTFRVVAARPLFGWGEDTLGLIYGRYQSRDWEPGDSFDRAHSLPLDLAAAQGVVGLAACAWLFSVWWLAVVRHRRLAGFAGAAAAYLAWALLNFDWAPATAALWLLAGAAWPAGQEKRRRRRPHLRSRIHTGRINGYFPATLKRHFAERGWGGNLLPPHLAWRGALAGVVGGVALALASTAVLADLHFYRGQTDQAAVTDPLQPRYRSAGGSLDDLRTAAHLHDPQPRTYVALGDAEARAGHPDRARAAYETALELYPYYGDARQRLGLGG